MGKKLSTEFLGTKIEGLKMANSEQRKHIGPSQSLTKLRRSLLQVAVDIVCLQESTKLWGKPLAEKMI